MYLLNKFNIKSLAFLDAVIQKLQYWLKMWYIIIIYSHHGSQTKYSTAHISGSTGPKMFKLWQNREAMSTRGWLSLVTIARWEPLISSMWKKIHLDIIVSWQPYLSFNALRLILLRIFFFFGLPCGLARPLIYIYIYIHIFIYINIVIYC